MKCSGTNALVPIQKRLSSLHVRACWFPVSFGRCRERYQANMVFSVYTLDEQGYIYGENCRLVETLIKPLFIDVYV